MALNTPLPRLRWLKNTAMAFLLLSGWAAHAAPGPSEAAPASRAALACMSPSNCVNSFDTHGLGPLRYEGPPEEALQALQALRTTLASFPQAEILKADAVSIEVVFTTFLGFRDLVDFKIDAAAQRIDYRSRSLKGKYDFGKNHSRMVEFAERFKERNPR